VLLAVGHRDQATSAGQAAYDTALQLQAEPLSNAVAALARRGRLRLNPSIMGEEKLAGLTPREIDVLRLLVEGCSNRQIAEQLFISGSTAGVHVTNILADQRRGRRNAEALRAHLRLVGAAQLS
jgi:DNA-binding NarL/FixJ family response regulator